MNLLYVSFSPQKSCNSKRPSWHKISSIHQFNQIPKTVSYFVKPVFKFQFQSGVGGFYCRIQNPIKWGHFWIFLPKEGGLRNTVFWCFRPKFCDVSFNTRIQTFLWKGLNSLTRETWKYFKASVTWIHCKIKSFTIYPTITRVFSFC